MMIQFARLPSSSSPSRLTVATLLSLALLPLYLFSYHYRVRHPYGGGGGSNTHSSPTSPPNLSPGEVFTQKWLSTSLIQPFDPAPLAAYCNHSYSTASSANLSTLVLHLFDANGGIGNVRGNFLDFVFVAIELGAAGIFLPSMAARDESNLSDVWGHGKAGFGHMFDEERFVRLLRGVCPGLEVYKAEEGMEVARALGGVWRSGGRRVDEDAVGQGVEALRTGLRGWVEGNEGWQKREGGEGEVVLVNVERTLWDVDTRSLPRGVRRNFGQLVSVAEVYRSLAAVVTWRLAEQFGLEILPGDVVPKGAFYGAHLRTADDAKNAGWLAAEGMNATAQMDEYMAHAKQNGLNVIYVASGNMEDVEVFKTRAAAQSPPMVVASKSDLLSQQEAETVAAMSWDQQALIDWEVLKRCSVFGGIVKSSFAFNIAITRHQYLEDRSVVVDPWSVQDSETNLAFDDGISRIFGRDDFHERRIPRGMWP